jgi:SAM-dependent methyltransferase
LKELLNQKKLLTSGVVANNRMNRSRGCAGSNSYQKDLSIDVIEFLQQKLVNNDSVEWLDICCGEGRALIETATFFANRDAGENSSNNLRITGIDLAGMFREFPADLARLQFLEMPIEEFKPLQEFDLITCVHGLHYLGDKLSVIQNAASWLKKDGIFLANLELNSLRLFEKKNAQRVFSAFLRKQGFEFNSKKHLLTLKGKKVFDLPFEYLGADDQAGPNYTGQPAIDSHYKINNLPELPV